MCDWKTCQKVYGIVWGVIFILKWIPKSQLILLWGKISVTWLRKKSHVISLSVHKSLLNFILKSHLLALIGYLKCPKYKVALLTLWSHSVYLFIFLNYSYKSKLKNFAPNFVFCTTMLLMLVFIINNPPGLRQWLWKILN